MKKCGIMAITGTTNQEQAWVDVIRKNTLDLISQIQNDEMRQTLEDRYALIDKKVAKYYVASACLLVLNAVLFLSFIILISLQYFLWAVAICIVAVLLLPCTKTLLQIGQTVEHQKLADLYTTVAYRLSDEKRNSTQASKSKD